MPPENNRHPLFEGIGKDGQPIFRVEKRRRDHAFLPDYDRVEWTEDDGKEVHWVELHPDGAKDFKEHQEKINHRKIHWR